MFLTRCATNHDVARGDQLEQYLDQVFGRFWGDVAGPASGGFPRTDVSETEDAYVLEAELPGMRKEDIKVEMKESLLLISGEKRAEEREKTKGYHRIERSYGVFNRAFRLPTSVDESHITARYENGVLRLTVPKREEAKLRQIEIKES